MFHIFLGFDYWMALLIEDAGAPPNYAYPALNGFYRVGASWTVRF